MVFEFEKKSPSPTHLALCMNCKLLDLKLSRIYIMIVGAACCCVGWDWEPEEIQHRHIRLSVLCQYSYW